MYLLCSMHVLHCLRYSCIRLNQVLCLQCVFTLTTQASHQYTFERWRNKRLGRGSWCHLIPRLPQLFEGQSTQRAEPRRASWLAGEVSPELRVLYNRTKGWKELHSWSFLTLWFWVLVFFLVMFQSKKPNKKSGHHFITLGPWPICQASLGGERYWWQGDWQSNSRGANRNGLHEERTRVWWHGFYICAAIHE